jgi:predicted esterase
VAKGQTLGGIARRYEVTVAALCKANGISRSDPIRPGQRLAVPERADEDSAEARPVRPSAPSAKAKPNVATTSSSGMQTLAIPGAPSAYYYEPLGRGRLSMRPVIVVLHGRGGDPSLSCRRWARVARVRGWLVCPSGPGLEGGGRTWNNDWATGRQVVLHALHALREKYGRRVQLYGNTLVGFSEGAFVAMNVAVREPRAFNRWLILAADDSYWGAAGHALLARARLRARRAYLITGKQDSVVDRTLEVKAMLAKAGIATRMSTPEDMGHEVALGSKAAMYGDALAWLDRGDPR